MIPISVVAERWNPPMSDIEGLTLLGHSQTEYPREYAPQVWNVLPICTHSTLTKWSWTVPSSPACAR